MTRRDLSAVEIDGDDAAWLRGKTIADDGAEVVAIDEVEFWGRTYEQAPGSALYVPASDDAAARVLSRARARMPEPAMPIGISLFSGCGGFDLGMHEAGFDVVAAVEWDPSATSTYLHNLARPDCELHFASDADRARWTAAEKRLAKTAEKAGFKKGYGSAYRASQKMPGGCRAFFFGDICKITGAQMMEAAGVTEVDVVFGGPPCQGLSRSNAKACLEDPRNGLLWEFLRMVEEIRPKTFIIENVPPLLTVAKGALFNAIAARANELGYNLVATKLNAVEYGVPQYRLRAIIVGTRADVPSYRYPMPTNWAVGRPIEKDGWTMLRGEGDDEEPELTLPVGAVYNRETRTWSVNTSEPTEPRVGKAAAKRARKKKQRAEQIEIEEGVA